jgi:membrane-associated phospholipid phosphatase
MVAFAAGALAMSRVTSVNRHWDRFAPDEAFRGLLRLNDPNARHTVRNISDGLWYGSMLYPVADAIFVVGPRTVNVAWQLFVVDGEALALGALESQLLEPTAGRARPFVRGCGKNSNYDLDCETSDPQKYESFISGHTLMSFTGAGLTCANHLYLPIYGARAADVAACAGALTIAATEGTMRVMSDRHYMSDVAVGALLGFATGYGTPALLRYRRARAPDASLLVVLPYASSTGGGAVVASTF